MADGRTLVVIGASAGGVEALTRLVADLPGDLGASVVIVLHVPASGTSVLPAILDRHGALPVRAAEDGDHLAPGRVYVAPPDRHVLVQDSELVLNHGPKENGHRPAIDPLFITAARAAGARVIGVILSGTLDDGTAGLGAIKLYGGLAVVQDPADALYAGMPASAVARVDVDHVVPLAGMASLLTELVNDPPDDPGRRRPHVHAVPSGAGGELSANDAMRENEASGLACPECGGALWTVGEGPLARFRCRIGHVYSEQTLLLEQGRALETALWTAHRALEERAAMLRRMAGRARDGGHDRSAARFEENAREVQGRAAIIREHIVAPAIEASADSVEGA